MLSSTTVANRLFQLAGRAGYRLTPMQLVKLVFLCHGWMLGLYGKPLVRDRIEAWKYGPVIPKLYNAVKQYRGGPISQLVPGPAGILECATRIHRRGSFSRIWRLEWAGSLTPYTQGWLAMGSGI
jgi:uncharacterized phage-associated protein